MEEMQIFGSRARTVHKLPSWILFLVCFLSVTFSPFSLAGVLIYSGPLAIGQWLEPFFALVALISGRYLGERDHFTATGLLLFYAFGNFILFYGVELRDFVAGHYVITAPSR